MAHNASNPDNNNAPPYYEQPGPGMPAEAMPANALPAHAIPVQAVPAQAMHMAACKGCGEQFVREPGINPASAQFHRCDRCNNRQTADLACLYATCGASSLCTIQ
ncbi:unnamed protein product [Ascophyllum nodosum]